MNDRNQYRREIGPAPSGSYSLADMQFSVTRKNPRIEESQINISDYDADAWVAIVDDLRRWP